jgi:hypothetical protein
MSSQFVTDGVAAQAPDPALLWFFLGGADLEMRTIAELLTQYASGRYADKALRWGAKASDYAADIAAAGAAGCVPVLVEMPWDLPEPIGNALLVDHHGERAGMHQPTSLEQVFALLRLPASAWTRWHALVAANDRGYIEAMQAMGASVEEMRQVRSADRAAQGVSAADEAAAEAAVRDCRVRADGALTEVDLPHARTSAVTDRLHAVLGGPGFRALAVYSPDETNVYADGALIGALSREFPGGWCGGSLPAYGFWGIASDAPRQAAIKRALHAWIDAAPRSSN